MATVKEIYAYLDQKAPFFIQSDFDNAGFLVGRGEAEVNCLLVALDITEEVVAEAAEKGAQLIVAHHPVLFHPAKSITDGDPAGRRVLCLIEHGIAAICAHTNLDKAAGGVNDMLAAAAGLCEVKQLHREGTQPDGASYGIGRVGVLEAPCSLSDYACRIKGALNANGVRYLSGGVPVSRVAVGGGACGSMLAEAAALGCDTFVTADVKYDVFLDAGAIGMNLIDAGHFPTENVVCPAIIKWLQEGFPDLKVMLSGAHTDAIQFL